MAVKAQAQQTLIDITDGYSVILTSESYTFPGTTSTAKAGSCTTQVIAMRGSEQVACSVDLTSATKPTGITLAKDTNATSPTITITASTSFTTAGDVVIPVTITDSGAVINKRFSVAIAFTGATGAKGDTGATGKGISSTSVSYQVGTSGTSAPTGTWSDSVVATTAAGQYLWTRTIITYSDKTTTTTYSVAAHGAKGQKGDTGSKGDNAYNLVITSSEGLIFKNSDVVTTLTAHVYYGGVELTDSTTPTLKSAGTINWYKDDSTTAVGTGSTLAVSAEDVRDKASYTAKLEG